MKKPEAYTSPEEDNVFKACEPQKNWGGAWTEEKLDAFEKYVKAYLTDYNENQCENQNSAFFFKQWGTWGADSIKRNKHANSKLLREEIIQEMPNDENIIK